MTNKDDIKDKIKKIYEVLPKLDDQRCGYRSCGEFARAVAEGRAPCSGCVSGGPAVAARVCEIMGEKVPQTATQYGRPSPAFYGSGLATGRGMRRGMGRGGGFGRGFGRGRRRG